MCLCTAYFNEKEEDKIAVRYVERIRVDGTRVVLTDVMGMELVIDGTISWIDLTGGTVVIATDVA